MIPAPRAAAAVAVALLLAAAPRIAHADEAADKRAATALVEDGIELLDQQDFAGALDLFQRAYATFPSPKIFANLGTALKGLGRPADAANYYQRYLDDADLKADRRASTEKLLATLDAKLALLTITVTPAAGAEISISDGVWMPAAALARWRVEPGTYTVVARWPDGASETSLGEATVGATRSVTIALAAAPPAPDGPADPPDHPIDTPDPEPGVDGGAAPRRGRIGAVARALIDGKGRGGAGSIGALLSLGDRVDLEAAAILGPTFGGYLGVAAGVLGDRIRPRLAAGVPVYVSDGPRWALRAAAGVEWLASPRLSLVVELGVEYLVNPEDDIDALQLVPLVGAQGRL